VEASQRGFPAEKELPINDFEKDNDINWLDFSVSTVVEQVPTFKLPCNATKYGTVDDEEK
jgi:hypothetical protein